MGTKVEYKELLRTDNEKRSERIKNCFYKNGNSDDASQNRKK